MKTYKDHEFNARVKLPVDQATPANRDIWFDSASGKLAFKIGGTTVLVPLPSDIVGVSVTDTATADLTLSGGNIQVAVLDSPKLEGNTLAQVQSSIISAIAAGASSAYDTLVEIQAILQADDTALSGLVSSVAARSRFYAGSVPSGSPSATVTHGLGLANIHDFMQKIFVSATGAEEEYAVIGATSNTVTVTDETGANIASGRRIFLTAGV